MFQILLLHLIVSSKELKENMNKWVTVSANVKEDFKKFHDLNVNELDGVAIMTDTDNSKMRAITYYQNIYFSAE